MLHMDTVTIHLISYETIVRDSLPPELSITPTSLWVESNVSTRRAPCQMCHCWKRRRPCLPPSVPDCRKPQPLEIKKVFWASLFHTHTENPETWISYQQRHHWCPTRADRPAVLQTHTRTEDQDNRRRRTSHPETHCCIITLYRILTL